MQLSFLDNGVNERRLIFAFIVLAMTRVFFLNAAYPVFNPVDELQHFDAVVKDARGAMFIAGAHISSGPVVCKNADTLRFS